MTEIDKNEYYLKIPSGYKTEIDGCFVEPIIYQPTPKGATIIADYYNDKYDLSISVIDHSQNVPQGSDLKARFQEFRNTVKNLTLEPDKPKGFILMHGQNHSVPVIMSKETQEDGSTKDFMIIFDSTSGSRTKGYYPIANMYPEQQLLLNNGTRQADGQSCITDSPAILKDALRIEKLGTKLLERSFNYDEYSAQQREKEGRPPNRFQSAPVENDNFLVFEMPSSLCKTAQISNFLEKNNADLDSPIISNKSDAISLSLKRESSQSTVSFIKTSESNNETFTDKMLGINRYLHKKSKRHAEIIDKKLLEMQIEKSEVTTPEEKKWSTKFTKKSGEPNEDKGMSIS
ncbi:MAG: hypothetical protein PQ612_03575 [Rickettsiales bacterium]|nr:hypothetical protein [Pseudomonadota bacterium]MDA0966307.1 hypothetical protein [Pseudomonadota bacterium]MDG4543028.1 hypothetical protein [Rickettsiales bacterium]MDG4545226.1 hypothetical protein [Rickettsiales bacterium]MDG4547675.1 hypothetical protein [Rickettsiales bacterium]